MTAEALGSSQMWFIYFYNLVTIRLDWSNDIFCTSEDDASNWSGSHINFIGHSNGEHDLAHSVLEVWYSFVDT